MSKAKPAAATATATPDSAKAAHAKPKEILTDAEFLDLLNWKHPQLKAAKALKDQGDLHGAALNAAQNAAARTPDGGAVGCIMGRDIAATRAAIQNHFGNIASIDRKRAEYCLKEKLPEKNSVPFVEDLHFVQYARTARGRGNDMLTCALLFATTGEKTFARQAIDHGLKLAATCEKGPAGDPPAAYAWHPHADHSTHGHDFAHALQYWMQGWPLIEGQMTAEEKLAWVKVLVQAADDRYRGNITEIPFNITFHPLLASLQVAAAFPVIKDASLWIDRIVDRFERDMCGLPCMSADGFTREHPGYHNVNTRITTVAYLTITRALNREVPVIRKMLEKAYEVQALFMTPNHQLWQLGDTLIRATHEHWQDCHEALQLAAALFNRPDFKAQSGSSAGHKPELLNAWLMGPEGIARYAAMPEPDIHKRELKDAHAPNGVFHVLRAGHGQDGHCGILAFGSSFNHGHCDFGEALVYGYGRELLSDPGHFGYGGDHLKSLQINIHACCHVIRRTPLGPRHDWPADWVQSLGTFKSDTLSLAQGRHLTYENHIVKRALALVTPFGPDGSVFWLIHDHVQWKKGWPQGNEPMEMIDTLFPFHAPASKAQISSDGRSVWSRYEGIDGKPFHAGGPTRRELVEGYEISDSDANLQVTGLDVHDKSQWDFVLEEGQTTSAGETRTTRPVANSHWRGYLPHARGFVMVPYRGLRDTEFASVSGKTTEGTLSATVQLPEGKVTVELTGLDSKQPGKLAGTVKTKK
ncbi:MAG TPA: hypothetical protein VL860_03475 [Planctomycetota bacterium]|nr:hypothetical protein [Planctomycetota bacterium]